MIKCLAIDDEPLALDLLKDNIGKVPFLDLVGTCVNAFEAMEVMQEKEVDLIFVDIQMPGLTGLQFIGSMEKKPMVIFITAYKQYALESYDLAVVDYLVKPVSLERFVKACNRAKELFKLKSSKNNLVHAPVKEHFFVNVDYSQRKLKFNDIIWMKGYGDYIKFYLKNTDNPLVVRISFKDLEMELPPNKFIRIHKSHLVAIDEITSIRKNSVFLGEKEISIGEAFRENIEQLFK